MFHYNETNNIPESAHVCVFIQRGKLRGDGLRDSRECGGGGGRGGGRADVSPSKEQLQLLPFLQTADEQKQ